MKKHLLIAAIAITALASCSSNDFVGDESPQTSSGNVGAISFNLNTAAVTRATGSDAASALGNYFLIYGEKKETAKTKYEAGNLVFPNYTVKYVANTANTTNSNSKNWEYVGITPISTTYVKMHDGGNGEPETAPSEQTIKYWDYSADSYTFTAVSALSTDISSGKVIVQKNTVGADNVYQKGYSITLKQGADASKLFFADRNVVTNSNNTDRNIAGYGGYVQMNFRNLLSQIRVGMYETIPGYQVNVDKFYYNDSANPEFNSMSTSDDTNNFYANLVHQAASGFTSDIILNVTYTTENQPTLGVSGGNTTNFLTLGTNIANPAGTYLGEDANHVIFDQSAANSYTAVFPQETNTYDMKMKVDYTLYNSITGETIKVTGATVTIPAKYLQWKANYKYSYILKITDDKLYPITFDAVTVDASDGSEVQYITTVDNPSITTYAKASAVTTNNEYLTSANIYVVVDKSGTVQTLTTEGNDANAKLYIATVEDGAAQGISEESIKNAIAATTQDGYGIGTTLASGTSLNGYYIFNGTSYVACDANATVEENDETLYYLPATYSVKDANGKKLVINADNGLTAVSSIAAADSPTGVAITVNGAKFTPDSEGTYVFEFIDTADSSKKYYKIIKVVDPAPANP